LEKQIITLLLYKNTLNMLKHVFGNKNISFSGLLNHTLTENVHQESVYQTAKARQLALMERGFNLGYGQTCWTHEELHQRR
jgi:hypothetical protein